jgi:hypothetical protein
MATQRYSFTPHPIHTLLTWVKSGEIAIPEIVRPFVWAAKVGNLLDSLDQGFPVGYLIAKRNPTVKLRDGTRSVGMRILIDGQQRVTALMGSLLGTEVLMKDNEHVRIRNVAASIMGCIHQAALGDPGLLSLNHAPTPVAATDRQPDQGDHDRGPRSARRRRPAVPPGGGRLATAEQAVRR